MSAGRILMVDDDPQIRRVMRVTLTAEGYEVSEASSGEEALQRLQCENYDLVLLDMNMPDIGGIKVCRTLRHGRHGFELAIIMLTVRNTEKDKVDALDAGADDYVTKPFSISGAVGADSRRAATSTRLSWLGVTANQARGCGDRLLISARHGPRPRRALHAEGVRPAFLPHRASKPNSYPSRTSACCLGGSLRRRSGVSQSLRQPTALED